MSLMRFVIVTCGLVLAQVGQPQAAEDRKYSDVPQAVLDAIEKARVTTRIDIGSQQQISEPVLKADTIVFNPGCSAKLVAWNSKFLILYADHLVFQPSPTPCTLTLQMPTESLDGADGGVGRSQSPAGDGDKAHPDGRNGSDGGDGSDGGNGRRAAPLPDLYIFAKDVSTEGSRPVLAIKAAGTGGGRGGDGGQGGYGQGGGRGRDDERGRCTGGGGGGRHGEGGDRECGPCEPNGNGGASGSGGNGGDGGDGADGTNGGNVWLVATPAILKRFDQLLQIDTRPGEGGKGGSRGAAGAPGEPGGPGARRYCGLDRGPGARGHQGRAGRNGADGKTGNIGLILKVEWR